MKEPTAHMEVFMGNSESVRPKGARLVAADGTGLRLTLPWGWWAGLLTLLLGLPSGYATFKLVTCDEMAAAIHVSEQKQAAGVNKVARLATENSTAISGLTVTIGEVQTTQHMDIAAREARRVVDEVIICKRNNQDCADKKDAAKERLRRANMKRLAMKPPLEPCASLACN